MLYNNLSGYLKAKYNKKIGKICIDAGFTCPNRDGRCGTGGCIFCGERGAGEHIDGSESIREQVSAGLAHGKHEGYIAYFQNFTNTYANTDVLKRKYDSALFDQRIVALAIGTRPDCITDEIAALIATYNDKLDVWVELGLQSASDKTSKLIGRGYKTEVFAEAVKILKKYSIPFVVHMIIGLPSESREDVLSTLHLINECGAFGIKIHSIYVMKNTRLEKLYLKNLYTPPTFEEYTSLCAECIARLNPDIVVHRLTGDCPRDLLVAPEWNRDKNATLRRINEILKEKGQRQGSCYKKAD